MRSTGKIPIFMGTWADYEHVDHHPCSDKWHMAGCPKCWNTTGCDSYVRPLQTAVAGRPSGQSGMIDDLWGWQLKWISEMEGDIRGLVAFKKHLFPKSECLWRLRLQKNRWSRTDRTKVFLQNPPFSLKKHHSQACRLGLCHGSGTSFRCCACRACSGPQTEGWMARCFRDW